MTKKFESFNSVPPPPIDAVSKGIISDISHTTPVPDPIHRLSDREVVESRAIYLKPSKSVADTQPFNEKYRKDYEYDAEIVCFIAEHHELIGAHIETWTKKYAGIAAEFWEVPTGKVVYGPRYLAERISGCSYRRLKAENRVVDNGYGGQIVGGLAVETVVNRLSAQPANQGKKSIFMSA